MEELARFVKKCVPKHARKRPRNPQSWKNEQKRRKRKYIPALKNMPTRYIHEPWMAPNSVQQSARCIIGHDYPMPMVDHAKASQVNLERIKQVYAQLAKFKPQGTYLNPQIMQTPNVMQSSPSPTSIITSINQSNYLCSQSSDSPVTQNSYSDDVFLRPTKNVKGALKSPAFKKVVIVQQSQNNRVSSHSAQSQKNVNINSQNGGQYRNNKSNTGSRRPDKEKNYDFKNLAINNHIQKFSTSQNILQGQSIKENEIYQQAIKSNNYHPDNYQQQMKLNDYNSDKIKFYLSNFTAHGPSVQNAHLHNDVPQAYRSPDSLGNSFMIKDNRERGQDKSEDAPYTNKDQSTSDRIDKGN